MKTSEKIPVILVTGFLGSGKTTFLRRLAETHPDWRLVFLVNEFAESRVDADSLAAAGTPTQSVVGGSLFCHCKAGEFVRVMQEDVLGEHKKAALDAVVIETSGIADPEAIGKIMSDFSLDAHYFIQSVVCIVSPQGVLTLLDNMPNIAAQIRSADLLVINKQDLAGKQEIHDVGERLRLVNPEARLVHSAHCRIDFQLDARAKTLPANDLSSYDANPYSTRTVAMDHPVSAEALRECLEGLSEKVLRVKGVVQSKDGWVRVEKSLDSMELTPVDSAEASSLVVIVHEDEEDLLHTTCAGLKHLAMPRIGLLACDVFEKEIEKYREGTARIVETRYFEMGLHDRPDVLRATLQAEVDSLDARDDIDVIVLAYGLCGCGTAGLHARNHRLVIPRGHDCITVFLGSKEHYARHQSQCPGCVYYTPGWNRGRRVPGPDRLEFLRKDLLEKFDEEDVEFLIESEQQAWAMHDTATYIELGTDDAAQEAEYAEKCAMSLGWKFEHIRGDASLLKDLLHGPWDKERFQIVEVGEQLAHSPDEQVMKVEPVKKSTS